MEIFYEEKEKLTTNNIYVYIIYDVKLSAVLLESFFFLLLFIKCTNEHMIGRPKSKLEHNVKMDLKKLNGTVYCIWLRIGTSGGILRAW
jgi:hypothetical protein